MFGLFKKKEKLDSRIEALSGKYKEMVIAVTNFTKSEKDVKNKAFIILTATEKNNEVDEGHIMAVGGSTKSITESLVNAGRSNNSVAKMIVTAAAVLIHADKDLKRLYNGFDSTKSPVSEEDFENMSEKEIEDYAKRIIDKGFGGRD